MFGQRREPNPANSWEKQEQFFDETAKTFNADKVFHLSNNTVFQSYLKGNLKTKKRFQVALFFNNVGVCRPKKTKKNQKKEIKKKINNVTDERNNCIHL